jgi:hypothetical protein
MSLLKECDKLIKAYQEHFMKPKVYKIVGLDPALQEEATIYISNIKKKYPNIQKFMDKYGKPT